MRAHAAADGLRIIITIHTVIFHLYIQTPVFARCCRQVPNGPRPRARRHNGFENFEKQRTGN